MKVFKALLSVCLVCAVTAGCRSAQHPRPKKIAATPEAEIHSAITSGLRFLLTEQNTDGSWGSATLTKDLNIFAPIPGSHQGFRAAVTSLCVMAMIEADAAALDSRFASSLERAENWLMDKGLARVRRADMTAIYNVWAHAYGTQALVRMLHRKPDDAARQQRVRALIELQVRMLDKYEYVGGGWGYYDFNHHLQSPGGDPNSFTTATVLLALKEARDAGIEVPQRLMDRGLREIHRQQNPNFTYLYSRNWKWRPTGIINRPAGSLGRSQACNLALRLYGDEKISDEVLTIWLDRLFSRDGWLDIGRKRPVPHEAWFAIAGYFYYYGFYHGSICIELLPPKSRPFYKAHMAHTLMERQEKDGSWFDFPFYAYHKPYGTAFAIMCLERAKPTHASVSLR